MRLLIALIAVLLAAPATAQVTAPTYRNSAGQLQDGQAVVILNPDGSAAGGAGSSAPQTQGNAAAGTADSGNPVKIGGVYNSTFPTYTTGQRADIQTTARGLPIVALGNNGGSLVGIATPVDGQAATDALAVRGLGQVFNGTTWDRMRGDTTGQYVVSKGGGSLATGQVSVGTSATLIAAARAGRQKIGVTVTTAVQCAFGNPGVTLSTGWPLAAVAYASDSWDTAAALYGVCASAATTVAFREQY